jgi:hypothetical protein
MTRAYITASIDDALHFTEKQRQEIIDSYPEHEKQARVSGVPVLGSGRVFPVSEDLIRCEPREWPDHWPRIGGMDFGWDHYAAFAELIWDRDADVCYVNRIHRVRQSTPIMHVSAVRPWGKNLPWAWPRDGRQETLAGAGIALADQYAQEGLNMLPIHAQFDDKSVSVEAGLMMMLQRMQTGRLKVMSHLNDFWDEFRLYHRKDGKVVKEGDDAICAVRYGLMMMDRYAVCIADEERNLAPRQHLYRGGPQSWQAW